MRISLHPEHPAPRRVAQVVTALQRDEVIAYPTDTVYGLGCDLQSKRGIERIYQLKNKSKKSPLSFICSDLKDIARYARVEDQSYRLMKRLLPGPYTLILRATKLVPKVMLSKQKTVGIRIPDNGIALAIARALGRPLVTGSVPMPEGMTYNDPEEIDDRFGHRLGMVIDAGLIYPEPSTILDLSEMPPRLIRRGKGLLDDVGHFDFIEDLDDDNELD